MLTHLVPYYKHIIVLLGSLFLGTNLLINTHNKGRL